MTSLTVPGADNDCSNDFVLHESCSGAGPVPLCLSFARSVGFPLSPSNVHFVYFLPLWTLVTPCSHRTEDYDDLGAPSSPSTPPSTSPTSLSPSPSPSPAPSPSSAPTPSFVFGAVPEQPPAPSSPPPPTLGTGPCSPTPSLFNGASISPLACHEVLVASSLHLDWAQDEGGIGGSGLSMFLPSSRGIAYNPALIALDTTAGVLNLTSTKGSFHESGNDHSSVLGVGLNLPSRCVSSFSPSFLPFFLSISHSL